MVDIVLCVHQLPPRQTSAQKTFVMTLCDNVHSGDVALSCSCFIVAMVLVGWVSFLGIPVWLYIYVSGCIYRAF